MCVSLSEYSLSVLYNGKLDYALTLIDDALEIRYYELFGGETWHEHLVSSFTWVRKESDIIH